ncbi:hypothetical protein AwWohl_10500 [Gammaproteobacteria bacterium]|nr:hypothetical protein AwWohl_10500 [Gammaproteobacteria bacterium]
MNTRNQAVAKNNVLSNNNHMKGSIKVKTQRWVGLVFFLLLAFLFVPYLIKSKPPEIPIISADPISPNIDAPIIVINVDQEGNIQDSSTNGLAADNIVDNAASKDVNNPELVNSNLPVLNLTLDETITPTIPNPNVPKPINKDAVPANVAVIPPKVEPFPKLKLISKEQVTPAQVKPVVVKPVQVKPVQTKPVSTNIGKSYFVQVGVFSKQANANEVLQKLKKAAYPALIEKSGAQLKVRVGPFTSEAAAKSTQARLNSAGHTTSLIRP